MPETPVKTTEGDDDYDMQRCEFCPAVVRIEDAHAVGDAYLCPQCYREGLAETQKNDPVAQG